MGDSLRVRVAGPLSGHAAGFVNELVEAGYRPNAAAVQLRLLAHLSRWLEQEGIDPGEFREPELERFRQEDLARVVSLRIASGLGPLLGYLRRLGVVPPVEEAARSSIRSDAGATRYRIGGPRGRAALVLGRAYNGSTGGAPGTAAHRRDGWAADVPPRGRDRRWRGVYAACSLSREALDYVVENVMAGASRGGREYRDLEPCVSVTAAVAEDGDAARRAARLKAAFYLPSMPPALIERHGIPFATVEPAGTPEEVAERRDRRPVIDPINAAFARGDVKQALSLTSGSGPTSSTPALTMPCSRCPIASSLESGLASRSRACRRSLSKCV